MKAKDCRGCPPVKERSITEDSFEEDRVVPRLSGIAENQKAEDEVAVEKILSWVAADEGGPITEDIVENNRAVPWLCVIEDRTKGRNQPRT